MLLLPDPAGGTRYRSGYNFLIMLWLTPDG